MARLRPCVTLHIIYMNVSNCIQYEVNTSAVFKDWQHGILDLLLLKSGR